jgi:hypothetical protein
MTLLWAPARVRRQLYMRIFRDVREQRFRAGGPMSARDLLYAPRCQVVKR